jgi:hypothetical protein
MIWSFSAIVLSRQIEDRWVLCHARKGKDHVAEADIDLHVQERVPQLPFEAYAHSPVVRSLGNCLRPDGSCVEREAVRLDLLSAHLAHDLCDSVRRVLRAAEQVDVPGGASQRRTPHRQHKRAFQHESVGVP